MTKKISKVLYSTASWVIIGIISFVAYAAIFKDCGSLHGGFQYCNKSVLIKQ